MYNLIRLQYHLADHCNLACSNCGTFSPYLDKHYPELESFKKDITRLAKELHCKEFELHGGEPLLNKQVDDYLEIIKQSGIADKITVLTNGKMLPKMSDKFFSLIDYIRVSTYPNVNIDYKAIHKFLCEIKPKYKFTFLFYPYPKFYQYHVDKPHSSKEISKRIYLNYCRDIENSLCPSFYNGKMFKCNQPYFLPKYLKKIGSDDLDFSMDSVDIHIDDFQQKFKEYMETDDPLHSCDYCFANYTEKKNMVENHHQIVDISNIRKNLPLNTN